MRLRRNTLVNLVGQLLAVAISLAAVPPLLRRIGEARYGVMLVVWVLLGYFALFDLGVGQATTQRMATLRDAPAAERSRLLWTALAMNVVMGFAGALLLFLAGYLVLGRFVSMDPLLRAESLHALPWIALTLPVSMAASPLSGALQGREAFGASIFAGTVGQLLAQAAPLFVAYRYSVSLECLIPAALLARAATGALLFVLCRRLVPLIGAPRYDSGCGRQLLTYGSWITVSSVVGPLMSSLDRLLIGGISGSEAITYYGVPQGLASRVLMLPSSVSGALLPRLAGSEDGARESLAYLSIQSVASIMTPAIVAGAFLVGPFLSLWISPAFAARATPGAQVLLLGVWFNGLAMIAHSTLLARGRPDLIAKTHLAELPAYLALLAITLHLWGVTGAAIAWSARAAADAVLLYRMSGFLRRVAVSLLVPVLLLGVALVALRLNSHFPRIVVAVGLGVEILAVWWAWRTIPLVLIPKRFTGLFLRAS